MPIKIDFLANVVGLLRGTRDVGRALEDVSDSLDDVVADAARAGRELGDEIGDGARDAERAADRMGRALGDGVRDGARDAERSTDRLARSFRELSSEAAAESKDAGDSIKRNVGGGMDDLKDEAKQSGKEAAASFSGGFDDVGDFAQETIANGLAGFGPLGLAAGIGLAAAVGVGMEQLRTDADRTEQRVGDMFNNMLEAGNRYQTEAQLQAATRAIAENADQWALALERQAESGVEIGTILRAMVGDADAVGTVRQELIDKAREEREAIQAGADSEQIKADRIDAVNTKLAASTEWLDQIIGDTDTAAARAAAVASSWESVNLKAQALRDTVAEVVRDLDKVGQGISIPIRADTTGFEGALAGLQGRSVTVNVNGQITRIGNQTWD